LIAILERVYGTLQDVSTTQQIFPARNKGPRDRELVQKRINRGERKKRRSAVNPSFRERLMTIYERALEFVRAGDVLGLGSGRASTEFIKELGVQVREGLAVRGVATSRTSEELARSVGIPIVSLAEGLPLVLTVDGADEVDPNLDLIKGYGRALVREKVVAAASRRLVILVGPGKEVPLLGSRGKLPVEVLPFALPLCKERLAKLGCTPVLYEENGKPFVTDNGNYLLDCAIAPILHPDQFEASLRAIPGVVGTGLFLGMTQTVLVGDEHFNLVAERRRTIP
jgi:ribose 5-phosphate isomerase A